MSNYACTINYILEAPTNRAKVQDFFASDDEANSNSKFFCSGSGVIYQTI